MRMAPRPSGCNIPIFARSPLVGSCCTSPFSVKKNNRARFSLMFSKGYAWMTKKRLLILLVIWWLISGKLSPVNQGWQIFWNTHVNCHTAVILAIFWSIFWLLSGREILRLISKSQLSVSKLEIKHPLLNKFYKISELVEVDSRAVTVMSTPLGFMNIARLERKQKAFFNSI